MARLYSHAMLRGIGPPLLDRRESAIRSVVAEKKKGPTGKNVRVTPARARSAVNARARGSAVARANPVKVTALAPVASVPKRPATPLASAMPLQSVQALTKEARKLKAVEDRRKRQRAEQLLQKIALLKRRIRRDYWLLGDALREILREQLYAVLGHQSFEEMIVKRDLMSVGTARKLILIAEQVSRDDALDLSQEKAYALVQLKDQTPEEDTVADLVRANPVVQGASIADSSARRIKNVSQRMRQAGANDPKARALAAQMDAATAALVRFLQARGVASPRVTSSARSISVTLSLAEARALLESSG
jgi:hypothetical protein